MADNGLLGVVIGGIIGIVAGPMETFYSDWRARRGLRAAIRSEIISLIEMTDRRGYEAHFQSYLDHWKAGEWLNERPTIVGSEDPRFVDMAYATPVMARNIEKLGMLGRDISGDVARFYSIFFGIRGDLKAIADGTAAQTVAHAIHLVESDLALWKEARTLATNLIHRL